MTIYVRRAGNMVPVTRVYVHRYQHWQEVFLAQVLRAVPGQAALVPMTVHDRYQLPPTNLRGLNEAHLSCTLNWDPPSLGTSYRVLMQSRKPGTTTFGPVEYRPGPVDWIPQTHYDVMNLQQDMEYRFTVQAKRLAPDGTDVVSPGVSNAIILSTGHAAVNVKNASYGTTATPDLLLVEPTRTDTWMSSFVWDKGPNVIQGYASSGGMNGWGVVSYGTNPRTKLTAAVATAHPQLTSAQVTAVVNTVQVTSAVIDQVYRPAGSGGSTSPTIHIYACNVNFASKAHPTSVGTGTTFVAPALGKIRDEIPISLLPTWAREWIKPAPVHNGMLVVNNTASGSSTIGYNGYCTLRAAHVSLASSSTADWRLKLWVSWNYTFPDVPARWI